eukprot:TRINITY_DN1146_c0_g1_i2.p1 TRINITY_DN1146_c0_g1~~TRINITY_DN1146_c0_g1_i2.p1  ORF type:complete len:231 (+),score=18.19 TRINITY_DN1146_c0_g1_i2:31-693(+)
MSFRISMFPLDLQKLFASKKNLKIQEVPSNPFDDLCGKRISFEDSEMKASNSKRNSLAANSSRGRYQKDRKKQLKRKQKYFNMEEQERLLQIYGQFPKKWKRIAAEFGEDVSEHQVKRQIVALLINSETSSEFLAHNSRGNCSTLEENSFVSKSTEESSLSSELTFPVEPEINGFLDFDVDCIPCNNDHFNTFPNFSFSNSLRFFDDLNESYISNQLPLQ